MSVKPIPAGFENVIPFLVCNDTQKVIDFAVDVFGAKVDDISKNDKGTIMHATIHIRSSAIMLSEASKEYPPNSAMIYIYVDNVDDVYKKGIEAGGESLREPTNEFYGDRSCGLKDISGNQWWIASHVEDVSPEEIQKRQKELKK
ncbi:MAG: VOC family protein [Ignavibacteria bacterium]|nr:VOC family protein [Ignavibacteria bacterium]